MNSSGSNVSRDFGSNMFLAVGFWAAVTADICFGERKPLLLLLLLILTGDEFLVETEELGT